MGPIPPSLGPQNLENALSYASTSNPDLARKILEFVKKKAAALEAAYSQALPFFLKISELRNNADINRLRSEFRLILNTTQFQEFRRKVIYLNELDTQFDAEIRTAGLRFGISELVDAPGSLDSEIAIFVHVLDDARSPENDVVTSEQLIELTGRADQLIQKFESTIAKVEQIEARATSAALGITGVLGQQELAAGILRRNPWFSGSFYLLVSSSLWR
jgi:hypothetical protein